MITMIKQWCMHSTFIWGYNYIFIINNADVAEICSQRMTSGKNRTFLSPVFTTGRILPSGVIPRYKPRLEPDSIVTYPWSRIFSILNSHSGPPLPCEMEQCHISHTSLLDYTYWGTWLHTLKSVHEILIWY